MADAPAVVVPSRGDIANYDQTVELDGVAYTLKFRYNGRDSAWYLSIHDATGPLRCGLKLVPNYALLRSLAASERRPLGDLIALDSRAVPLPPAMAELGTVVKLVYLGVDP